MKQMLAIQSFKDGHLKLLGKGEFLGHLKPMDNRFENTDLTFKCVKLEEGGYAWSFQAHIIDKSKFNKKNAGKVHSIEKIDFDRNIRPYFIEDVAKLLKGAKHKVKFKNDQEAWNYFKLSREEQREIANKKFHEEK